MMMTEIATTAGGAKEATRVQPPRTGRKERYTAEDFGLTTVVTNDKQKRWRIITFDTSPVSVKKTRSVGEEAAMAASAVRRELAALVQARNMDGAAEGVVEALPQTFSFGPHRGVGGGCYDMGSGRVFRLGAGTCVWPTAFERECFTRVHMYQRACTNCGGGAEIDVSKGLHKLRRQR